MAPSSLLTADIEDPLAMRQGSPAWLSLALMDARNRSLRWWAAFEPLRAMPALDGFDPPAWMVGHAAWFQEYWISRCPQRGRGAAADPAGLRLASIEPRMDAWFAPPAPARADRWAAAPALADDLRDYLAATLDTTLELLEKADGSDSSLYFYRLALLHEDRIAESLGELARAVGFALPPGGPALPTPPARGRREPIGLASATVWLGTPGDGFAPDNERLAHEVHVPGFEMDAQAVCWAEFSEFAADGGYDDRRWWSPAGWDWIEATARRAPRYVEQLIDGVLVHRAGRLERAPAGQAVQHVCWYEADAWCRWAGRRLPTEVEWEVAAHAGPARGLRWGDVWEWTASTFREYPGFRVDPYRDYSKPWFGTHKVLRGASLATSGRMRHPKFRNFYRPERDDMFCGFRSCSL